MKLDVATTGPYAERPGGGGLNFTHCLLACWESGGKEGQPCSTASFKNFSYSSDTSQNFGRPAAGGALREKA